MFNVNWKYILYVDFLVVTNYLLTAAACLYFPIIKLMKPVGGTYTSESHLCPYEIIFLYIYHNSLPYSRSITMVPVVMVVWEVTVLTSPTLA